MLVKLLLSCAWLVILLQRSASLQCLNEQGLTVDWFFVYKVSAELKYSYYDAKTSATYFTVVHDKLLSDGDTAIGATIAQIWNNSNSYDFIAYNDEPPYESNAESYGHTKGILAYSSSQDNGLFLIHSWPKFPNFNGAVYNVDKASPNYAQTFLCISYTSFQTMDSIAHQLRYNKPKVYKSSSSFSTSNNFTEILNKRWMHNTSVYSFQSINNVQSFTHFAKSGAWKNALYEYLVSPYYNQSFIWETWRRHPPEPSFCKPQYSFDELNVEQVILDNRTQWKYTHDHGKIGCSSVSNAGNDKPFVCVGDINRMYSQYYRGGGTCCFQHQNLWKALNAAFIVHDGCDSNGTAIVKKPTIHPHPNDSI